MKAIGILVPLEDWAGALPRPWELPLGRLALGLRGWGVELLFLGPGGLTQGPGGLLGHGLVPADAAAWTTRRRTLAAVYNRYPSAGQPGPFARAAEALRQAGVPWGNGGALADLCTDKLRTGNRLLAAGLPYPQTVTRVEEALELLPRWGALYAKPRYGSLGEGVHRVEPRGRELLVEPLALRLDRDQARRWLQELARSQPYLFQKAVRQPAPQIRGCGIRSLVQKRPGGLWHSTGRVARVSATDVVANVARGAQVRTLEELCAAIGSGKPADLAARLDELDAAVAAALDSLSEPGRATGLELGIDYALDPQRGPVLLEVNGKPLGRFAELERRGLAPGLHARALLQPIQVLDALSPPSVLDAEAVRQQLDGLDLR